MTTLLPSLFVLAFLLTAASRYYALHRGVMDHPGARSSHNTPTPRLGGVAIVVPWIALLSPTLLTSALMAEYQAVAITLAGAGVALVSLIDDHRSLSPRSRLAAHFLLGGTGVMLIDQELEAGSELHALTLTILIFAVAWLTNLYNFMDGINGLAGLHTISVLLGGSLILYQHNDLLWGEHLIILCAPVAGFLVWNFPKAKTFMGDAGSTFLGITLALLGYILCLNTSMTAWAWIILLGIFIADATWTLLVRIFTHQRWSSPHNSHAYQILARRYNSHTKVTLALCATTLIWLTPIAITATKHPAFAPALALLAYTPLIVICIAIRAGHPDTDRKPS